jgi:type I pantothenate kinase
MTRKGFPESYDRRALLRFVTDVSWYVDRFLRLRETAFRDPSSYFRRYAAMDEAGAVARAEELWSQINGPNLERNIAPTSARANVVLCKGPGHDVTRVRLRKV